ncbi:MAG: restriction endonuclease [Firmicutes bacterium]|nr:restriction endonuclease [Bacillota bacterium]MCL1953737.1 restriction endonuclease [Bacillota bacterium]
MFDAKDFKKYRQQIGIISQKDLKLFLSAKDIVVQINFEYVDNLTLRLKDIIKKINQTVHNEISTTNIQEFIVTNIDNVKDILKESGIISKLNNQGRRPEQVYFSWMRGFVIAKYFAKALSIIFGVEQSQIVSIGKDTLDNPTLFSRQPDADFELQLQNHIIRFEIQSGYQGINDIKQHKVREAKKQYLDKGIITVAIHFDVFNGQVAFVNISSIEDSDINWITRQQMEGQTVFNINQQYFIWRLVDKPPNINDIKDIVFNDK